jgi:membrane fusion protein, heavy metal efflux system
MLVRIKSFVVIAILTVILISGCNKDDNSSKEENKEKNDPDEIKLSINSIKEIGLQSETTFKSSEGFIVVPAIIQTNQDNEAQVGSLVQGRVYKVFVKAGSYVKKGQELMLVEGLEIGEIKSGFLKARANLEFQKSNYERQKTLIDQKVGSQKSFLESQAEYEKALAEFNAEDKKIHAIGLNDDDLINVNNVNSQEHTSGTLPVKSPIDGIVAERNVVIGQYVDGTTNAFKIINTGAVWCDGQIYEKDIDKITEKTKVIFTATAYPDEKLIGNIIYIGQVIDEKTRTITIRAEFNNPNQKLKPQMFGEMQIPCEKNSAALFIPVEALVKIDNNDFVFIQKSDSIFEKRAVTTGSVQNDRVEIRDGIKAKENVVVKGVFYLKSELMKSELEEGE